MTITRRLATGTAAVTVAAGSLIGGVMVGTAGAAPAGHSHCQLKHGKDYPSGQCFTDFSKDSYHPGDTVKFKTGSDFGSGAKVGIKLKCHKFSKNEGSKHAGTGGKVKFSFTLPDKTPKGLCTVTITGGSSTVTGSFTAKP